jgi:hypothetical protein
MLDCLQLQSRLMYWFAHSPSSASRIDYRLQSRHGSRSSCFNGVISDVCYGGVFYHTEVTGLEALWLHACESCTASTMACQCIGPNPSRKRRPACWRPHPLQLLDCKLHHKGWRSRLRCCWHYRCQSPMQRCCETIGTAPQLQMLDCGTHRGMPLIRSPCKLAVLSERSFEPSDKETRTEETT